MSIIDASKINSRYPGSNTTSDGTINGGGDSQGASRASAPGGESFEHHSKVVDFGKKLMQKWSHLDKILGEDGPVSQDGEVGGANKGGGAADTSGTPGGPANSKSALVPADSPVQELSAAELRKTLSADTFKNVAPNGDFPKSGQERLLNTLKMASGIKAAGYNVFVTGYGGDGESIANLLKEFPPQRQNPKDYVYVRNFDNVNEPVLIIFEPGQAKPFQQAVNDKLKEVMEELPTLKGSSNVVKQRVQIEEKAMGEVHDRMTKFEKQLTDLGFGLKMVEHEDGPTGAVVGLKMLINAPAKGEEAEEGNDDAPAEATTGGGAKKQVAIVPFEAIESAVNKMDGLGLKPVFVLQKTTAGPAFVVASEEEYKKSMVAPAVKLGQEPPPAYDVAAIKGQFREFREQSLEMNAANEATQVKANKDLQAVLKDEVGKYLDKNFEGIRKDFPSEYVSHYLDGVKESIQKSLPLFINRDEALAMQDSESNGDDDGKMLFIKKKLTDSFKPNVVSTTSCDSRTGNNFPVVYEKDPTWENLLGTVQEPMMIMGGGDIPVDRHSRIKGGSILKAQGGYLVVDLLDAAQNGSLGGLLRAVKTGKLQIEPPGWSTNKPEPIPLNVKVIILDPEGYYDYLAQDRNFGENFIKAPFDRHPKAEEKNMTDFASSLQAKAEKEKLLPVAPSATAAVMEEAMGGMYSSQERFQADFGGAMDLLREANSAARQAGSKEITADHVKAALDERKSRLGMYEEREREEQGPSSENKPFVIETTGSKVGQINGLSVYMMSKGREGSVPKALYDVAKEVFGKDWMEHHEADVAQSMKNVDEQRARALNLSSSEYGTLKNAGIGYDGTFGGPSRITATAWNAEGFGVVSNDEKPKWVGPSGLKAYQNLESYFGEKFGSNGKRLFGEGRLSFEQSYGGHDGDSATMAEFSAIISAFSKIPIKQGIAITGSMDEHGMAQAIGGENFKISGFFDVCKEHGFDGTQGVIIPASNAKELMLRPDIVQAVKDGKFHIWPVKRVEDAIELLTGVKAGEKDPKTGKFQEGTVYGEVEKTLDDYRKNQKLFPEEKDKNGGSGNGVSNNGSAKDQQPHHFWNIAK